MGDISKGVANTIVYDDTETLPSNAEPLPDFMTKKMRPRKIKVRENLVIKVCFLMLSKDTLIEVKQKNCKKTGW